MRFEFATTQRIIFGPGCLSDVGALAAGLGKKALLAVGMDPVRAQATTEHLAGAGIASVVFQVPGEPTTELVAAGAALALEHDCDLIVGFGGGSSIDAAKAIAALVANRGEPLDYLEVVGRGRPLVQPSLPVIAVPTTAGTGAEVTRNAVLLSPDHGIKASMRSPTMLPRVALVDPELTLSLPPDVTASTGLDALTQLIEPFTSIRANPMTDAFCREGLPRAARSLRLVYEDGGNAAAREDMALASLLGGLSLANAGLGAVHGFAGVIGGQFPAPHGAICAALLPHVMSMNLRALGERQPESPVLSRYHEVAGILTNNPDARAADGMKWVWELARDLQIPPLHTHGIAPEHVRGLVEKASVASSTKANPISLTTAELTEILEAAL
jgi:alcohol dehydrogenase class IV